MQYDLSLSEKLSWLRNECRKATPRKPSLWAGLLDMKLHEIHPPPSPTAIRPTQPRPSPFSETSPIHFEFWTIFWQMFLLQVFDYAKIARWRHSCGHDFKRLSANYLLINYYFYIGWLRAFVKFRLKIPNDGWENWKKILGVTFLPHPVQAQ